MVTFQNRFILFSSSHAAKEVYFDFCGNTLRHNEFFGGFHLVFSITMQSSDKADSNYSYHRLLQTNTRADAKSTRVAPSTKVIDDITESVQ